MAAPRPKSDSKWFAELPCSVTICDRKYKIVYMNETAAKAHKEDGGKALVGTNLMDCHQAKAQRKLRGVMNSGTPNVYTIEKKGVKKQIFQCQWREKGRVAGLVELSFEVPWDMPHHVRD